MAAEVAAARLGTQQQGSRGESFFGGERFGTPDAHMAHLREALLPQQTAPRRASLVACHAALALAQIASGVGIVYLKLAMNQAHVDSVSFSFWRFVGATPLLLALAVATRTGPTPQRSDVAWFALLGVLLVLNQLFANLGVELAGALLATCMQPTSPVLSAAMAVAIGQEQHSLSAVVGIALGVAGAVVVAAGRATAGSSGGDPANVVGGFACLVINTSSFAAYCVCMKAVVITHGAVVITGASHALGLLVMSAVVVGRQCLVHNPSGLGLPSAAYGVLAYWVLCVSVGSYCLVSWANRHLPASTVALYAVLQPAVGAALSVAILGEQLRYTDLGALLIVCGMLLVVLRSPARPAASPVVSVLVEGSSHGPSRAEL